MKSSKDYESILQALIDGATLKAHRYLDGAKLYKLHPPNGLAAPVERETIDYLKQQGFIRSNMKFPAATYLLTEKGKQAAAPLPKPKTTLLSARMPGQDAPT